MQPGPSKCVALSLVVGTLLWGAVGAGDTDPAAIVVSIHGAVTRAKAPLAEGTELSEGDVIVTGPSSRAKLMLADRSIIDLGPKTTFRLDRIRGKTSADREVGVSMGLGRIRAVIQKKLGTRGKFQIRTKSSVLAVRGTHVLVESAMSGGLLVDRFVLAQGDVTVTAGTGAASQRLALRPGDELTTSARRDTSGVRLQNTERRALSEGEIDRVFRAASVEDSTFVNALLLRPRQAPRERAPAGKSDNQGTGASTEPTASSDTANVADTILGTGSLGGEKPVSRELSEGNESSDPVAAASESGEEEAGDGPAENSSAEKGAEGSEAPSNGESSGGEPASETSNSGGITLPGDGGSSTLDTITNTVSGSGSDSGGSGGGGKTDFIPIDIIDDDPPAGGGGSDGGDGGTPAGQSPELNNYTVGIQFTIP